jgi:hypothetical protein
MTFHLSARVLGALLLEAHGLHRQNAPAANIESRLDAVVSIAIKDDNSVHIPSVPARASARFYAGNELLRTSSEMVSPMSSTTASMPLIREAVVIAFSACGTPESGSTIKFMNRYTKPP